MNRLPLVLVLAAILGVVAGHVHAADTVSARTAPIAQAEPPSSDAVQRWLLGGNAWFIQGGRPVSEVEPARRTAIAASQSPWVTVLTCSDSRVPPEHIFNAGLGYMFTVRVAGNVADPATVGSVEYAAEHLHTPVVVVMGHERCGAVKAALGADSLGPNLDALLAFIRPGIRGLTDLDAAVKANVHAQVTTLKQSAILSHLLAAEKLTVLAAVYDLDTGVVGFLETPKPPPAAVSSKKSAPRKTAAPAATHH